MCEGCILSFWTPEGAMKTFSLQTGQMGRLGEDGLQTGHV